MAVMSRKRLDNPPARWQPHLPLPVSLKFFQLTTAIFLLKSMFFIGSTESGSDSGNTHWLGGSSHLPLPVSLKCVQLTTAIFLLKIHVLLASVAVVVAVAVAVAVETITDSIALVIYRCQ